LTAPLTAAISMIISVVFVLAMLSMQGGTLSNGVIDDVIGAGFFLLLPMGVCSLLAYNHRVKPANRASARSALS
jgi:hypothetical protein